MLYEDILSRFFYISVGEHGFIIPSPSSGYRLARFAYQYFSYLTPLFAFFPHCGACSQANPRSKCQK